MIGSGSSVRRARWASLAVSTILASGVALPALAQEQTAPVRQSIDANGVDLFLGTMNVDAPTVSIGASGSALTYQRLNRGGGWTDNYTAYLTLVSGVTYVSLGGVTDRFSGSTSSTEGNGSTLTFDAGTNVYTYTRADGTVIHFDRNLGPQAPDGLQGRATDVTQPSGERLTYTYGSITYCTRSKQGGSGQICLTHANSYRVATVTNAFGYQLSFGYDEISDYDPNDPNAGPDLYTWSHATSVASANVTRGGAGPGQNFPTVTSPGAQTTVISDALGRSVTYRSSNAGLAGITRPGGSGETTTITYAGARVSSVTNANGTTTYTASDAGSARTVGVTDALSHTTNYVFEIGSQRMTDVTDPLSRHTHWDYDGSGRVTRMTLPEGNAVATTYDPRGNVTERRQISKTPGSPPDIVTSASYPASCGTVATCNQPTSTTDARGAVTDYGYDSASGQVTSVTAPASASGARPQVRYGYTSINGVTLLATTSTCRTSASCADGADEVRTTIGYDANLQPSIKSTGSGDGALTATTSSVFDAAGNVTSVDGPLPGTDDMTTSRYDAARQLIGTVSPDPDGGGPVRRRAVQMSYAGDGQVSLVERGSANDSGGNGFVAAESVATGYDAYGRKTATTLQAGGTAYALTQWNYDGVGRPWCVAQRINPAAYGSLPDACTGGPAGPAGLDRIAQTAYDQSNQATSVTSALGTAEASTATMGYTANGQTAWVSDGQNNRTSYGYDGFDRLTTTAYPVNTPGQNASNGGDYDSVTYDANSNVTSRRLRDGQTISYTYDALNRRTYEDNPNTNVAEVDVSYGYDLLGRLTNAGDQNSWTMNLGYDALGRMTSQASNIASNSLGYDLAGRLVRQTWSDGFFVAYEHYVTGETSVVRENGGLALATFGYDDLGRRTSIVRGNGTTTSYSYDAVSRLASLTQDLAGSAYDATTTFAYNPAGQIASRTTSNDVYAYTGAYNVDRGYTANGLNQYTQSGEVAPTYDARGNLTSAGSATYQYNTKNQLFMNNAGQLFYHGPSGLLGQVPGSNLDYVGTNLTGEYSGGVQRRYVFDIDTTDAPLVWYEGAGTSDRRYLAADERGSIVAVSDQAGNALAINRYDEYGIPQSGNLGRFQYTGQKWIPELGMYDYKARMYSPTFGRFLQTDPIGYGDGLNFYNYVGGDPLNASDPNGTEAKWQWDCYGNCGPGYWNGPIEGLGSPHQQERWAASDAYNSVVKQAKAIAGGSKSGDLCLSTPECGGNISQKLAATLLPLLNDKKFKGSIIASWAMSKPFGSTNGKNEFAFWSNSINGKTSVGEIFKGSGSVVKNANVYWNNQNVFTHTHPFTTLEGYLYGFSHNDRAFLEGHQSVGVMIERDGLYYYDGRGK